MKTPTAEKELLERSGYTFEYPGFWMKSEPGRTITIADGESCNGYMWEVQMLDAEDQPVLATEGFESAQAALDMVAREVPA